MSGSLSHLTAHYLLHISQGEHRTTLETHRPPPSLHPLIQLSKRENLFPVNPTLFSWLRFFKTETKAWKPKGCLCWSLTRGPGITSLCQLERWRKKKGDRNMNLYLKVLSNLFSVTEFNNILLKYTYIFYSQSRQSLQEPKRNINNH